MTEPDQPRGPEAELPPVDELDELASALLDGEADDADRARLADPAVRAEVERRQAGLARAQAAVAAPVAVDPAARDAAIAAALAAADEPASTGADELAARRAAAGRGLRLVGVAAAVVAALAVGIAAFSGSGDTDDAAGDAAAEASLGDDGAADAASPGDAPEALEESGDAAGERSGDLGDFDSVDALLDVAAGRSTGDLDIGGDTVPSVSEAEGGTARPDVQVRCAPDGEQRAAYLTASVAGAPVEVWVVDGDVVALDAVTCEELGRTTP